MPAEPKVTGREWVACQARARPYRARIHNLMTVGNNPIGLNPPVALGSSTMRMRLRIWHQPPFFSKAISSVAKAMMADPDALDDGKLQHQGVAGIGYIGLCLDPRARHGAIGPDFTVLKVLADAVGASRFGAR